MPSIPHLTIIVTAVFLSTETTYRFHFDKRRNFHYQTESIGKTQDEKLGKLLNRQIKEGCIKARKQQ